MSGLSNSSNLTGQRPPASVSAKRELNSWIVINKNICFSIHWLIFLLSLCVFYPSAFSDRMNFPLCAVSAKRVPPISVSGCDSNWLRRHSGQYLIRLMWPLVRAESIAAAEKKPAGANTSLKLFHTVFVSHLIATPQLLNHLGRNVSIIWLWVMDTSSELFLRACIIVYSLSAAHLCVSSPQVSLDKRRLRTWLLNDDIQLHSCNPSISLSCIQFEPVDRISDPISTGKYSLRPKI